MRNRSDTELLARAKTLVDEERRITAELLESLEEIQRRRLYAGLGYSSLWEFATRHLGLSEGAAQRRIQAMRLVRDVPEAKESLRNGSLSLSNAAKVQSFRQNGKKRGVAMDPKALLKQVENLSQKECEQTLLGISPEAMPRERERQVSPSEREIRFVASDVLYGKLQRLRGLLAHSLPEATYAELLEHLADQELGRLRKAKGLTAAAAVSPMPPAPTRAPEAPAATDAAAPAKAQKPLPAGRRVSLPVSYTRPIWRRAQGRCEIVRNGRRCTSTYRLQLDHIEPLSQGGGNDPGNLRLTCWHHNQWLATRSA